jgi:Tol biopolymer transport system component
MTTFPQRRETSKFQFSIRCAVSVILLLLSAAPDGARIAASGAARRCPCWHAAPIVLDDLFVVDPGKRSRYRIQVNGKLLKDGSRFIHPAWSPNRRFIAAGYDISTSNLVQGTSGIFEISVDGSKVIRLTYGDDDDPCWSPDGRYIAFTRNYSKTRSKIEMLCIKARSISIVADGGKITRSPRLSPDGKKIAFVSSGYDAPGLTCSKIYLKDMASGRIDQIVNLFGGDCDLPRWRNDSKKIVFTCTMPNNNLLAYVIDSDGRACHKLPISHLIGEPVCWSPDGKRLAFISYTATEAVALKICDPDGHEVQQLDPPVSELRNNDFWPDW